MSLQIEEEIAELFTTVEQLRLHNYLSVACLTILLYDCITSLNAEVKYIWKSKWTLVKALYIFARYYGLLRTAFIFAIEASTGPSNPMCLAYLWVYSLGGGVLFTTTVNVIFMLRIQALYDRSIKVWILLISLLVAEFVLEMYLTVTELVQDTVQPFPPLPIALPLTGCNISSVVTTIFDLTSSSGKPQIYKYV